MRFGIRVKLLVGFGVMLCLSIIVGVVGLLNLASTKAVADTMYDTHILAIDHLAQARGDLGLINGQLLQALVTPSVAQQRSIQRVEGDVDRLMAGVTSNATLDTFHADWSRYRAAVHNALTLATTQNGSLARSIESSCTALWSGGPESDEPDLRQ